MKVLVAGVTGFVGRHLVPLLPDADHDAVVFVCNAAYYNGSPDVEMVEGDIFEPTTLGPVTVGIDAACYLIHSMHAGDDFEARDRLVVRNFVDTTGFAGVGRLVYLSGLGEDHDQLSAHLRPRHEVEHILASGAPAFMTFRAAIIIDAGSMSFEMVCQLATCLPVVVTPQWVETWCQPIAITGVAAYLAGVLDHPETAGEIYEIGGPGVLTYREMLQCVGAQLGHAPRIVSVPVLTPRFSSYWIGPVTDVGMGVARPFIEGLKNPVVVGDDRICGTVVVDETLSDVAIERALREEREQWEKTVKPASTTLT